jgi:hypothetical protein
MNDTEQRCHLEQLVRGELAREATRLFPERTDIPVARAGGQRQPRSWWPALSAAVLVAALALLTVVFSHSSQHSGPAAAPTRLSAPTNTPSYPEASTLSGVRITSMALPRHGTGTIRFTNGFPSKATLTRHHTYVFTTDVSDTAMTSPAAAPLVVRISAQNASLRCPPSFLIRTGHTYAITCAITPADRTGKLAITLTSLTGQPVSDVSTPFNAR